MDSDNSQQPTLQVPETMDLAAFQKSGAEAAATGSRTARFVLIGLLGLVVSCVVGNVCPFLVSFATSFPEEKSQIEKVIDNFLRVMANKDAASAYTVVYTGEETQITLQDLQSLLKGNNYILFQGYRNISVTDLTLNQVGSVKSAEVAGFIGYSNDFVGDFSATMVKENGAWKIQAIRVNVPPGKFGQSN